jgi:hypothetical protein
MSLTYIGQQFTLYGGSILFITGIFGNGMNIFIFSSVHSYRTTPCTFYFLIGSICNGLYILFDLISRILNTSYGIDLTTMSLFWCKVQHFLTGLLGLTSFTCSCLATIDQFLITSKSVFLRSCSKIQWAYRIVFISIIVWSLHLIPTLLYYDISSINKICLVTNSIYNVYISIYFLGPLCLIPILIMLVFGCLAYRNIRQTIVLAQQNADRQLMRTVLIQIVLVVVSMGPFGIYMVYNIITTGVKKDLDRQLKEYFALTILVLVTYFYYVVCLFLIK